jgi:hypothetical protein
MIGSLRAVQLPTPRPGVPVWVSLLAVAGIGVAAVTLVPRLSEAPTAPPVGTLLGVGLIIIAAASGAIFYGAAVRLRLPTRVALYAIGYQALIVLVKFTLAPLGLYEVNRRVVFASAVPFTEYPGTWLAALFVFTLYFAVYGLIYRWARRPIRDLLRRPGDKQRRPRRAAVFLFVAGAILVTAATGLGVLAIPVIPAISGVDYLRFLFSSSLSLLVALALVAASSLAAITFTSATERARVLGDATALVGLFWLGLSFIALYHFLWVVYILILLSIWPLRVVVPK